MIEAEETATIPCPHNEEDELVFLDGKKRQKYIDEVKDFSRRVRRNPR
jgi:hypothetical protein